MLREIFRFELRQQLRSPLFWMIALSLGALALAALSSDHVRLGGGVGNTLRNAPYVVVTQVTLLSAIMGMFLAPIFVGGAALRDFEAGTADLFFTAPISRLAYLGGRFGAGYVAAILIMLVIAAGVLLGPMMPWVDPERVGPNSATAYAYVFAVFVLPNFVFVSALLFLLATLTRSMLGTYVGVIAFFVLWQIAGVSLQNMDYRTLGALIDPFGADALDLATRYWSAQDRNTRVPEFAGVILANRAIWIAVGLVMFAATLSLFRPSREGWRLWRRKATLGAAPTVPAAPAPARLALRPAATLRSDARTRFTQFLKLAAFDTRGVLRGAAFLVMLAFGLSNLAASLYFSNELFGTKTYPVTHLMTDAMDSSYTFLLMIIVAFYAGELVWRERSGGVAEVTDAFPLPDWIPLLSKLVALAAVIVAFLSAGALECVAYQLLRGFSAIEPGLYLSNLALNALAFTLIGALALFFQVAANNKFLGYLLIVLYFVSRIVLAQLDFDHHLYNFGTAPAALYSDMNGYGHWLAAHLWFDAYWAALAAALLTLAALFWQRGTAQGWRERTRMARQRFGGGARVLLASSLLAFGALGGWIFYNTNVLNRYVPSDVAKRQKADYETKYRQYLDLPQPKITDVSVAVDLYPHAHRVDIRGHYTIANKTDQPITDLHVQVPAEIELVDAKFAPHETVSDDRELGYTIYRLRQPLAPGAQMDFDFTERFASRGFRNTPNDTHVVDNGTFINNAIFPHFGYAEDGQLADRNDRRKYGLPQLPRMAKIDDTKELQFHLLGRDADWVTFDATVSTDADQIALAPGYLERDWSENGRHYFHYKMDKPIVDFFSFQSARYAVRRDTWHDVALEVYYDPAHAYNIDRMMAGMKKSLDYFGSAFSPYQFRQMRILEFPGYERFAQSFANTVPFSEAIGFVADLRDPDAIDYVFYVTAHELAHQWWGHQVIGARVQGVTMLDETFAQYSALMVQEHEYGQPKMRKFLKYELDRYLAGRGGEVAEELPLALNESQDYIHYRKGSVAMYALKDYVGEETVNRTLARYDHDTAFQQPPYTTSAEFLGDLRQDAGTQWSGLITDLFDKITVFDNRIVAANAKKRSDGKYDVSITLHAAKTYVDGVGKETPAKVELPLDIGVFARAPDGKEENQKVLLLEKRRVADGDSTISVTVDAEPYQVGIDPYNKLIDRVSDDNRMRVQLE